MWDLIVAGQCDALRRVGVLLRGSELPLLALLLSLLSFFTEVRGRVFSEVRQEKHIGGMHPFEKGVYGIFIA